jgi:hypothetical protein
MPLLMKKLPSTEKTKEILLLLKKDQLISIAKVYITSLDL